MLSVIRTNRALDRLADKYVGLDLSEQDRLAANIDALNHRLHADPSDEGESRTAGYRVTFVDDLTIRFTIEPDDLVVRVYAVRRRGE